MFAGGDDRPPKLLQIRQEDNNNKFFSSLSSTKEISKGEPSFRILYYGGATGAVPFTWESRPGTPKHPSSDTSLRPLTPPPSYHFSSHKSKSMQKRSKPTNFLFAVLSRFPSKMNRAPPYFSSSSVSSSCSSGSFSSSSTPMNSNVRRRWWLPSRPRSTVHFGVNDGDEPSCRVSCLSSVFRRR
ncbi:hypothetical protein U1Q18_026332 [Sarracenia purpurea var. burkii]